MLKEEAMITNTNFKQLAVKHPYADQYYSKPGVCISFYIAEKFTTLQLHSPMPLNSTPDSQDQMRCVGTALPAAPG
jgi:hypothetical protein